MTKEQFCAAIDTMYNERNAIDRAFMDQCNILNKFNSLLMTIVWLLAFLICMVIMDPPIKFLVTFSITLLGGAMFMFRDTAKKAFDSIVFVIFTHPFDAEDWILIREEMYQVHEVGLWTTTFLTSEGKLTYIANRNLVSVPITNLRRSPQMSEAIPFTVVPSTSPEKIKTLESKLVAWLKLHERDYSSSLFIYGFKLIDKDHLKLEVKLTHKTNFNDQIKKDMRTRRFVFKLKEFINELGIELSPPLRS
jgi:small-conductance mechanosensitive channel